MGIRALICGLPLRFRCANARKQRGIRSECARCGSKPCLAGGVRSLDRTLLRPNFPDKQGICRDFSEKLARIGRLRVLHRWIPSSFCKFPTQRSREFRGRCREFSAASSECSSCFRLAEDVILKTNILWIEMLASTVACDEQLAPANASRFLNESSSINTAVWGVCAREAERC